jgi:hypothetical protein
MRIISRLSKTVNGAAALTISLTLLLAGCGKEEVSVQSVPKESSPQKPNLPMAGPPPAANTAAVPSIHWQLPTGWEAQPPDSIRLGNFILQGEGGASAQTTIIPLPGQAGTDLDNVNRWRGQVGLATISAAEMASQAQKVAVGTIDAPLYEMMGVAPNKTAPTRILVSFIRQGDMSWFFKMTGDDALVLANKPKFIEFLKTIEFGPATTDPHAGMAMDAPAPVAPPTAAAVKAAWTVPAHWRVTAPGPMQKAKFRASSQAGEKIEATVSALAGEGGSLLGNVNRWRGQLELAPITEADLAKATAQTNWHGLTFTIVNLENPDTKMAMRTLFTAQNGETWFFKLSGEIPLVAREQASFMQFVESWKP